MPKRRPKQPIDPVPPPVEAWLKRIGVDIDMDGVLSGSRSFIKVVAKPEFTVLAHQSITSSHPEAPIHQWGGILILEEGTYRVIAERYPHIQADLLMARQAWNDFRTARKRIAKQAESRDPFCRKLVQLQSKIEAYSRVWEDLENYTSLLGSKADDPYDEQKLKESKKHLELQAELSRLESDLSNHLENLS